MGQLVSWVGRASSRAGSSEASPHQNDPLPEARVTGADGLFHLLGDFAEDGLLTALQQGMEPL